MKDLIFDLMDLIFLIFMKENIWIIRDLILTLKMKDFIF